MTPQELKDRTMDFAVRVLRMAENLPRNVSGQTIARQIARSGTSVAANYRAALRAKSRADFAHKVTIVLEEADETGFWIARGLALALGWTALPVLLGLAARPLGIASRYVPKADPKKEEAKA